MLSTFPWLTIAVTPLFVAVVFRNTGLSGVLAALQLGLYSSILLAAGALAAIGLKWIRNMDRLLRDRAQNSNTGVQFPSDRDAEGAKIFG
jgi:hypothetical protein